MTLGPFFELSTPIAVKKRHRMGDCEKKRYHKPMKSEDSVATWEWRCCGLLLENVHEQRPWFWAGIRLAKATLITVSMAGDSVFLEKSERLEIVQKKDGRDHGAMSGSVSDDRSHEKKRRFIEAWRPGTQLP